MNFHIVIHGPQRMSPNDIPDFSPATIIRMTFLGLSQMSQQLLSTQDKTFNLLPSCPISE